MRFAIVLTAAVCALNAACSFAAEIRGQVYDFGATWCGPCQQVAPVVEKLQREGLPIQKIDIDKQRDLADRFNVQQIPTFVLVVDGKEVDRVTGRLTESDLRRMVARIPQPTPQAAAAQSAPSPRRQAGSPMSIPVELGETAPINRPAPLKPDQEAPRVADQEHKRGLRDLLSLGRKPENAAPPVVRGNDSSLAGTTLPATEALISHDPMESSVRIRVMTNSRSDLGSGTIISSSAGMTRILTCAHIFKEFTDDSRIEVDVFERGSITAYTGGLIKFDPISDLGLISIPTTNVVPQVKVAGTNSVPHVGEMVAAIGCSGGEEPTRQQATVTDIDKYEGPHNLLCTGVPVRGRSGGGLFNQAGEIIGVCSAADEREQRGFYSGLLAIHKLLDEEKLTSLYAPAVPPVGTESAPAAPASGPERRIAEADRSFPEELTHEPRASATPAMEHSSSGPVDVQAGDAEVVVIIRDRSNPAAANRVVILHEASPKFLSYLSGELSEGELKMDLLGDVSRSLSMPEVSQAVTYQPLPAVLTADGLSSNLQPTTLSKQVMPRKYVRSASSR